MSSSTTEDRRVVVSPDDLIGIEIDDRYTLQSVIGAGGMGVVFRTTQRNLKRAIALKLLKIQEGEGAHSSQRFRREIDIIAQLSHPNVVRIFDAGLDPALGLHYIAMELIEGQALSDVVRAQRMRPELAIEIVYQTCAALTEPHELGIVHRDIKPGNILLTVLPDETIRVKVVDFGIARAVKADTKITKTGVVLGSPSYMAPEVAVGGTLDPRADIYALGVLFYELLSGREPFEGDTPMAVLMKHAVETPPSLGTIVGGLGCPELSELVDEMLAKDPDARPESARAVRRRLEAIVDLHGYERIRVAPGKDVQDALAAWLEPSSKEHTPYLMELDADEHADSFSVTSTAVSGGPGDPSHWLLPPTAVTQAREGIGANRDTGAGRLGGAAGPDESLPAPAREPPARLSEDLEAATRRPRGLPTWTWITILGLVAVGAVAVTSMLNTRSSGATTEAAPASSADPRPAGETTDPAAHTEESASPAAPAGTASALDGPAPATAQRAPLVAGTAVEEKPPASHDADSPTPIAAPASPGGPGAEHANTTPPEESASEASPGLDEAGARSRRSATRRRRTRSQDGAGSDAEKPTQTDDFEQGLEWLKEK